MRDGPRRHGKRERGLDRMRRCAVILAAHGSHRDPTANSIVISHAARIRLLQVFDEVFVAFHQGLPSFTSVLDTISADDVVVVPVMTSDGYYCNKILPNALRTNARFTVSQVGLGIQSKR